MSMTRIKLRDFLVTPSTNVYLVLIILILIFSVFSPQYRFLDPDNLEILLSIGLEFSILALGVGLLMICGEFDLSVGSILVFSAYVFLKLFETGVNLFLSLLIVLGVGALLGLANALITVKGRIPSFVTTLGTMMFWRGLTLLLSGGQQSPCDVSVSPAFLAILNGKLGNIPVQTIWFVAFAIILGIILHFHRFGNWVYATGDNQEAARAMGINTNLVKIICFMIVGVLCAFVACSQISRTACFTSRAGEGWEFKAVAASVIGGTSLLGGIGSMGGIFAGALIISIIENGLVVMRIPYSWTYVVFGLVILFSVFSNVFVQKQNRG